MSGQRAHGYAWLFIREADATGAWDVNDKLAGVKNVSYTLNNGKIVTTTFDDGDWEDSVSDIKTLSLPVTTNLVEDNAVQEIVEAAAFDDVPAVQFLLVIGDLPAASAKNRIIKGTGHISSYNPSAAEGGVVETSFTLDSKGTVTRLINQTTYPS